MAQYALFDLSEFLKLPKVNHTKQDENIMIDILNCVYELKPDNKVGALQKLISSKKIFKTNKNEVSVILDILGICLVKFISKILYSEPKPSRKGGFG
jgi:hypothetical protein